MSTLSRTTAASNTQVDPHAGGIPITITIDGRQRTAGFAMPNGFWYRRMERSRHFWRAGGECIGASRAALAEARRLGCVACKVVDAESGDTYLCDMADYERYGRAIGRAGWEPQIGLALDHWRIIRRDGSEVPPIHERQAEPAQAQPEAAQMALFGGAA